MADECFFRHGAGKRGGEDPALDGELVGCCEVGPFHCGGWYCVVVVVVVIIFSNGC